MYSDTWNIIMIAGLLSVGSVWIIKTLLLVNQSRLLLLFGFPLLFTSCLKEHDHGDCPEVSRIVLDVEDKNYSNIGTVSQLVPKDEQLPFRQYVANLSYRLRNIATGEIVANVPVFALNSDYKTYPIEFSDIFPGRYELSVLGNSSGLSSPGTAYTLHPAGQEGTDTYMLTDTIDFPLGSTLLNLKLKRTKGNIVVLIDNLPDSVKRVDVRVDALYRDFDLNQGYGVETVVVKSFTNDLQSSVILQTLTAPTVSGRKSVLRVSLFTSGASQPFMILPDTELVVNANELAVVKLDFKDGGGYEIWLMADGIWTKKHDMDIELS